MKKQLLALALAAILSLGAFAVGCDGAKDGSDAGDTDVETNKGDENDAQDKNEDETPAERKLRVLDENFKYPVYHEEYSVKYDDIELYGELWEPDAEGKFPLVILSHGFNGHCDDFPVECRTFAERGYVCYAFDFCGAQAGGKSTGRTAAEYTPLTMKKDLIEAVKRLSRKSEVDKTQIFLFGGSQGGFVTALAAADEEIRDSIAAVALYFPAFNIPDDWHGKPQQNTPLMGYSIGAEFIKSVQDLDPYEIIGDFKKDVCIVWGDQDELVARRYIDRAVETYGADRTELTVLPGAKHGFGGDDLTKAVKTVLSFLEARTYETV